MSQSSYSIQPTTNESTLSFKPQMFLSYKFIPNLTPQVEYESGIFIKIKTRMTKTLKVVYTQPQVNPYIFFSETVITQSYPVPTVCYAVGRKV